MADLLCPVISLMWSKCDETTADRSTEIRKRSAAGGGTRTGVIFPNASKGENEGRDHSAAYGFIMAQFGVLGKSFPPC